METALYPTKLQNQTIQTAKLLLVEDDPNLGSILRDYLELKGFDVELARDGDAGLTSWNQGKFDLCILDVMLPKKDGFTLARDIRQGDDRTPILFLTAKGQIEDKVEGFNSGGDDYLTKPFSMEELVLRVKSLLKRNIPGKPAPSNDKYSIGTMEFSYATRALHFQGQSQKLTTREAELLKLLCQHTNEVLERHIALNLIWGDDSYYNGRSMDVFITRLRKYLKPVPGVSIQNIHGKGFKLVIE